MSTVPPPVHHLETAPNSAAGFNRFINKLHDEIQSNVRILQQELSKGKSVDKACQVHNEDMFYIFHF